MIVMGIDPSLTSTGVVILKDGNIEIHGSLKEDKLKGVERLVSIEWRLMKIIDDWEPDIVAIEGYAYGAANKAHQIGELGGVIRRLLHHSKIDKVIGKWVEIAPTVVKKFATGKGNAKKEDMKLAVFKKWGVEFATNDETDAFVLAKMAEVDHGCQTKA